MIEITERQQQILEYIQNHIEKQGYSPSVRDIATHFKLASAAGVHKHIKALVRKKYLKKTDYLSRSLRVMKDTGERLQQTESLPLLGYVAAGHPIEAIENIGERLTIPTKAGSKSQGQYLLKVRGDSMIDDGILDGDYVIMEPRKEARNGETVVALIDGNEATLKRFYREGEAIRLQPANKSMEAIRLRSGRLEIQGVVRGLWRPYMDN